MAATLPEVSAMLQKHDSGRELQALLRELTREFEATDRALEALSPTDPDYDQALGRLAQERGRLIAQLTLIAGMIRRDRRNAPSYTPELSHVSSL